MPRPSELDVLVLTPDFPPARGGIQRLLGGLLRHAARLRPEVVTLASDGGASREAEAGFPVRRVPRAGGSALSAARLNLEAVIAGHRRRPDVILSGHIVTSPAAAVLKRMLRRPVIQYLYATEIPARPRLAGYAVSRAAASIAISRHTRDLAAAAGGPVDSIRVVPPGVDELRTASRSPRFERPTMLTVARLEERYKGHDVVMRALPLIRARVPEMEWIVVGDGRLRSHLESLAHSFEISDSVRFTGEIPDGARNELLERAHVFVMPSRMTGDGMGGEGFGIAYLEAAQRGLPVVAGNVGGALDAVEDGVTGVLVDPTSHLEVAEAVIELLLDRDSAAGLGDNGIEHARSFAWPLIARRVEDVLFEVARGGRGPT
jgi:phosphatidyl-myo-inositol dimannoside synthase